MKRKFGEHISAPEEIAHASNDLNSPPQKKPKSKQIPIIGDLESVSSSDEHIGDTESGNKLIINEEYAKRFEHNKKREERHRCMYEKLQ